MREFSTTQDYITTSAANVVDVSSYNTMLLRHAFSQPSVLRHKRETSGVYTRGRLLAEVMKSTRINRQVT